MQDLWLAVSATAATISLILSAVCLFESVRIRDRLSNLERDVLKVGALELEWEKAKKILGSELGRLEKQNSIARRLRGEEPPAQAQPEVEEEASSSPGTLRGSSPGSRLQLLALANRKRG